MAPPLTSAYGLHTRACHLTRPASDPLVGPRRSQHQSLTQRPQRPPSYAEEDWSHSPIAIDGTTKVTKIAKTRARRTPPLRGGRGPTNRQKCDRAAVIRRSSFCRFVSPRQRPAEPADVRRAFLSAAFAVFAFAL